MALSLNGPLARAVQRPCFNSRAARVQGVGDRDRSADSLKSNHSCGRPGSNGPDQTAGLRTWQGLRVVKNRATDRHYIGDLQAGPARVFLTPARPSSPRNETRVALSLSSCVHRLLSSVSDSLLIPLHSGPSFARAPRSSTDARPCLPCGACRRPKFTS